MGRNGQGQFWCGFCVQIIELKSKGLEAWDERFNHVDDRHFKKGQRMSGWVPVDGHGPKGLPSKDTARERSPACDQDEEDDDSSDAEPCPSESAASIPPDDGSVVKRKADPITSLGHPSKKARPEKDRPKREPYRYCVSRVFSPGLGVHVLINELVHVQ